MKAHTLFVVDTLFGVIVDLLVAALGTTYLSMLWLILYLQEYPDVQKKCQDEIQEVRTSSHLVRAASMPHLPRPYYVCFDHDLSSATSDTFTKTAKSHGRSVY